MTKNAWHQNFKRAPVQQRTGHDGFVYDSKTEMERYYYLRLLEKAGEISDLSRQPKHKLSSDRDGDNPNAITVMAGNKVAVYTPDFCYRDKNREWVIEDVKGYRDEASKFRIRVYEAFYPYKVKIVRKVNKAWVSE